MESHLVRITTSTGVKDVVVEGRVERVDVVNDTYSWGDVIQCGDAKFLLLQVGDGQFGLFRKGDANRWTNPVTVKENRAITRDEISKMLGSCGKEHFYKVGSGKAVGWYF